MTDLNTRIRQKAFGIMKSIEIMNESERNKRPSLSFGDNFNNLRALCQSTNPELQELLPPQVTFKNHSNTQQLITEHNFSEIHTFCSEIYHLLEDA